MGAEQGFLVGGMAAGGVAAPRRSQRRLRGGRGAGGGRPRGGGPPDQSRVVPSLLGQAGAAPPPLVGAPLLERGAHRAGVLAADPVLRAAARDLLRRVPAPAVGVDAAAADRHKRTLRVQAGAVEGRRPHHW